MNMKALLAVIMVAVVAVCGFMLLWGENNLEGTKVLCSIMVGVAILASVIKLFSNNTDDDE